MDLHYYLIASQPVADKPLLPDRFGRKFYIRHLTGPDPLLEALPRPAPVIAHRFDQHCHCIAATVEERLAGCIWLCLAGYQEDEVRSHFRPIPEASTAWDFDVWVAPEHRNSLLFAKLWDQANRYLREQGRTRTLSRISGFNPQSLQSHARLGAAIVQKRVYLVFGNRELCLANRAPRFSFSGSPARIPEVPVTAE